MREQFLEKTFKARSVAIIHKANEIIEEYTAAGYTLTLRQLYYQFVARDLLENSQQSYKRLGSVINDARLAGLISWTAIEDRTRNLQKLSLWDSPREILEIARDSYRINKWKDQPYYPEVWIEKEALVGVIAQICDELEVPYFACRGYTSQSEQWGAGKRFHKASNNGQKGIVLHLGDHDPSGIDMTRDNSDRLDLLSRYSGVVVRRLALNYDQIEEYNPPPNPAKMTDSRFEGYSIKYGDSSWELDALEPRVIRDLIEEEVLKLRDERLWNEAVKKQEEEREQLNSFIETLE